MWYIFEKRIVQGYQKLYSYLSNAQIHKYKYRNTQIHKYSIWWSTRKTQYVVYFWKDDCSRISKMIFPCVKSRKTQHVVYFREKDCSHSSELVMDGEVWHSSQEAPAWKVYQYMRILKRAGTLHIKIELRVMADQRFGQSAMVNNVLILNLEDKAKIQATFNCN